MILFVAAVIEAKSPLKIGSGQSDNTDSDILRGADGKPYIPGTALAGVCRHYFSASQQDEIFGYTTYGEDKSKESDIVFYDANLMNDYKVSNRDSVRISENNTAEDRGKFDYEIVESGSRFLFRLELKNHGADIINTILNGFNSGEIRIGGKANRGFGRVVLDEIKCLELDLSSKDGIERYINFRWEDVCDEFKVFSPKSYQYDTLNVNLELQSFLFIRNYVTNAVDPNNDSKAVDAEQLLNKNGNPVIPGTSWAGVLRHHFNRVLTAAGYVDKDILISEVFGNAESDKKTASKIVFSESVLTNSYQMNRTRNAVDRFTGGAGYKKLFTTRPTYKGKTELEIKLRKDIANIELVKSVLLTCINDINEGFLALGGETSTGGGIFKAEVANDAR